MVNRDWQQFALLLIDVQQDFWNLELEQAFPDFQSNIARLLRFCRQEGLEVVHLREVFNPDGSDWLPRYRLRGRAVCVRETPGAEVLSVATAQSGEMVMEKPTQDGFHHPPLLDYLRSTGKKYILTAGLVTSVCVLLTAASASQLGFLVTVISDCCADYPEAHAIALRRYRGFMLELACLDELPQRWGEWVGQIERLG
ncbi:isochorismatase family protein [Coleofasciculus chthonoplastes PCC 7420]|uniref:Isochorismatase family protein n=1 Tax=Coleofasciculus chthonoplastes PCC 7420 TaxID=118168 RepID=B4VM47_9CYAN|nr:cysteine hydrolase [Coleofasciculus chthonoplastes]EDX76674.1 isochorismatase family protein [Coleofasciculus chthonoplastes PCC 7420]